MTYIENEGSSLPVLSHITDYSLEISSDFFEIMNTQKTIRIPLKASQQDNYSIAAIGLYRFKDKLLDLSTTGTILVIKSTDLSVPTRVVYFGEYNLFAKTNR